MTMVETAPMTGRVQPAREEVVGDQRLAIIDNNLAQALLSRLRDRRSDVTVFNTAAAELARLVLYEACRAIPLEAHGGEGFDGGPIELLRPAEAICGIAILRAGLIFQPAFRLLLPGRPLYQLGIRRDERTLEPTLYTSNLPDRPAWAERVLIVDPMLATGGTATAAIELVRRQHAGPLDVLCLVAAPFGVQAVLDADPTARITTLALDRHLNDQGYIVPGLGDAGDRFFGT
jgi:uracil phosphoribosyltransferase